MLNSHSIEVTTITEYLSEHSDPEDKRFAFSYTITINNRGTLGARLLTRHWIITNAEGNIQEVHGNGVVGEQPFIAQGRFFRYTSGALLSSPIGTMEGCYSMIDEEGATFDVIIPAFRLAVPDFVH